MMNFTRILLALLFLQMSAFAQERAHTQDPALSINFFLVDFETATKIRSSTLSSVLNNKQFGKIKEMSPGLAVAYSNGLSSHFDFSTTLAGSFLNDPRTNASSSGGDNLLLEADASIRGKMFSNNYWFTPYVQLGVGASKYKGYYGAFVPIGVGLQLNLFDEAFLLVNSQYRIPVTESANYHFYHSIGLAGNIGKRKSK